MRLCRRLVLAAATLGVVCSPLTLGRAAAVDQTVWLVKGVNYSSGFCYFAEVGTVSYCRLAGGNSYYNESSSRDGDLRTSSDKYYGVSALVGNLSGSAANTNRVYNWNASVYLKMWRGACYTGTGTSIPPGGGYVIPSSTNNLRSVASASATGCA